MSDFRFATDEEVSLREQVAELTQQRDAQKAYIVGLTRSRDSWLGFAKQASAQRDVLLAAAENLVTVKGRYHTEKAYKALEATIAKVKEQK